MDLFQVFSLEERVIPTVLELFLKATLKLRCTQYNRWAVENTLFRSYSAGIVADWELKLPTFWI